MAQYQVVSVQVEADGCRADIRAQRLCSPQAVVPYVHSCDIAQSITATEAVHGDIPGLSALLVFVLMSNISMILLDYIFMAVIKSLVGKA